MHAVQGPRVSTAAPSSAPAAVPAGQGGGAAATGPCKSGVPLAVAQIQACMLTPLVLASCSSYRYSSLIIPWQECTETQICSCRLLACGT
jgi:hypothetical protein